MLEHIEKTGWIAKTGLTLGIVCLCLPALTILLSWIFFKVPMETRPIISGFTLVLMIAYPILCVSAILFGIIGVFRYREKQEPVSLREFHFSINAIVSGVLVLLLGWFVYWLFSSLSI